ncbi:Ribosomal large subunit pseudouridine synthase F [Prochlorococcus marinus str. MIT 9321]|uniref:Pseudouridine synthase n=1 Tax=Prochlorococcus marinus str. MIT 9401 TaxID=167551 RepID=A0A0A2B353_PROMR|nr:23S rRNA pseudouridine(2604) synthase RluF [Prochlorococcus marinus]KGG03009.1 Ribosomal large subunit pseudouridine synthase F [Prochlorococcus marinus str. MIT 9321]KGG05634.1 Ribosomal large subunit pseudouridine synthase F [Prochlorococcus marinus str. MIT 9322]KGG07547.1 Ribosomal large subunit pseudouridine synthase F [Prochlorococcus marinus str. MIT 9401]
MSARINKYLSEVGYCSRRAADKLIEQGKVTINGKISELGTRVVEGDQVEVEGQRIEKSTKQKNIYLAFNKPVGIVCTTDRKVETNNIIDFIKYPTRVFPIGRLDKPSEGLIFLTNDGDIVNKILRSRNNHEKEYIVGVNRTISEGFIHSMSNGVKILDTITKSCFVQQLGPKKFKIILTQGLNRQIRRMCNSLGYKVKTLKRIRIMNIRLDVPTGKYREFTTEELLKLNRLLENSSKTFD